jgi:hypothetical protein
MTTKDIAKFVIDKANGRGEISLPLADGKERSKDFTFKDGVKGELITEFFNKQGDNAKVFKPDGVNDVEDARVPECLVDGRYLEVANVRYILRDQAAVNQGGTLCSTVHPVVASPVVTAFTDDWLNTLPDIVRGQFELLDTSTKQLLDSVWSIEPPSIVKASVSMQDRLKQEPSFFKVELPVSVCQKYKYDGIDMCLPEDNPLLAPGTDAHQIKEDILLVMKNNEETTRSDVVALVGVSGAAKTCSTFLVASERVCIYTEMYDRFVGAAVYGDGLKSLWSDCEITGNLPEPDRERRTRAAVRKQLVVRILAYMCLYFKRGFTPYNWLQLQIDGIAQYITAIHSVVGETFFSGTATESIVNAVNRLLGYNIGWIIDECHILMNAYYGTYSEYKWSLLQLIASELCCYNVTTIAVGTILGLSEGIALATAVGKGENPMKVMLVSCFPYVPAVAGGRAELEEETLTLQSVRRPATSRDLTPSENLGKCLDLSSVDEELLALIDYTLQGRARNSAGFLPFFVSNRGITWQVKDFMGNKTAELEHAFLSYYNTVLLPTLKKNLAGIIEKPVGTRANGYDPLSDLVEILRLGITLLPTAPTTSSIPMLGHGICPLEGIRPPVPVSRGLKPEFRARPIEPIMFPAIKAYFESKDMSLCEVYMKKILPQLADSVGNEFDFAVVLRLMELKGTNVREFLYSLEPDEGLRNAFNFPSWMPKGAVFDIQHILQTTATNSITKETNADIYLRRLASHFYKEEKTDDLVEVPELNRKRAKEGGERDDNYNYDEADEDEDVDIDGEGEREGYTTTVQDCRLDAHLSQVRKRFMGNISWPQVAILPEKAAGADAIMCVADPNNQERALITFGNRIRLSQKYMGPSNANQQLFKANLQNQYMQFVPMNKRKCETEGPGERPTKKQDTRPMAERFVPRPEPDYVRRRENTHNEYSRLAARHQIIIVLELPRRKTPPNILRMHEGNVVVTVDTRNLTKFFGDAISSTINDELSRRRRQ